MRVIIAGSRPPEEIRKNAVEVTRWYRFHTDVVPIAVEQAGFEITELVTGKAAGFDRLGESWAQENAIPIKPFPADWYTFGRTAGRIRNHKMAEYADALIAITYGTPGTADMIRKMRTLHKPVYLRNLARDTRNWIYCTPPSSQGSLGTTPAPSSSQAGTQGTAPRQADPTVDGMTVPAGVTHPKQHP